MKQLKYSLSLLVLCAWSGIGYAQQTLKTNEFDQKLATSSEAQVVDVRTPEEYAEGHLKNARNVDIQNAQFEKNLQNLDKNKPVFVYCLSGGRSSRAMDLLVKQGFKEVYNLDGGYMKWSLADKPTEGTIVPKADEINTAQFEQLLKNNVLVLVDYNAKWCGPCKKILPIVEKLKTEYASKLMVMMVDVDRNKTLSKKNGVEALPALVLYKNGKIVWQQTGLTDEATLKAQINKNI